MTINARDASACASASAAGSASTSFARRWLLARPFASNELQDFLIGWLGAEDDASDAVPSALDTMRFRTAASRRMRRSATRAIAAHSLAGRRISVQMRQRLLVRCSQACAWPYSRTLPILNSRGAGFFPGYVRDEGHGEHHQAHYGESELHLHFLKLRGARAREPNACSDTSRTSSSGTGSGPTSNC